MKYQAEEKGLETQIRELETTILKKAEQYAHRLKINHVNTEDLNKEIGDLMKTMRNKTRELCSMYK
jgi:hypothetical protein